MSNELLPCPFCGGQPSAEVHAEGLHAEGGCERCGWTMEDWSGDLAKLIERMNTRPAPSSRMADLMEALEKWEAWVTDSGAPHEDELGPSDPDLQPAEEQLLVACQWLGKALGNSGGPSRVKGV